MNRTALQELRAVISPEHYGEREKALGLWTHRWVDQLMAVSSLPGEALASATAPDALRDACRQSMVVRLAQALTDAPYALTRREAPDLNRYAETLIWSLGILRATPRGEEAQPSVGA